MDSPDVTKNLGIADRIHRSNGRGGRVFSANAKVTRDEQEELESAAKRDGKALSEWAREVLLREARTGRTDMALFTEMVALRKLMSTVLRSVAVGQKLTPEAYAQILAEVRTGKHEDARELFSQYQNTPKER